MCANGYFKKPFKSFSPKSIPHISLPHTPLPCISLAIVLELRCTKTNWAEPDFCGSGRGTHSDEREQIMGTKKSTERGVRTIKYKTEEYKREGQSRLGSILGNPGVKFCRSFLTTKRNPPWEQSLLELVPEVEIQNGDIQKVNVFV